MKEGQQADRAMLECFQSAERINYSEASAPANRQGLLRLVSP
jgi:hypothetical protein